jgi:hypothetical protein
MFNLISTLKKLDPRIEIAVDVVEGIADLFDADPEEVVKAIKHDPKTDDFDVIAETIEKLEEVKTNIEQIMNDLKAVNG